VVARALGAEGQKVVGRLSREPDQTHHQMRALGVRRDGGLRLSRYRFQHIVIQRYLYHSLDDFDRTVLQSKARIAGWPISITAATTTVSPPPMTRTSAAPSNSVAHPVSA
jgi:hypothetical protein